MNEQTEQPQSETLDCHAEISISAGPEGLILNLKNVDDPDNPAVRFARYVCENAQALILMANQQQAASARAIQPAAPRLVMADGSLVN